MKIHFEFKNDENGVRFVINNNFFLYERKKFENYEGSQSDTETYLKLLIEFFKYNVQVQRLGVRKINCFYTKNKISCLKKIVKDKFMSEIDNEMNPKYSIVYTPLEKNDKNGYNLGMKLDYGVLEKNEKKQDVYRYILDIDSYIRDVEQIDKLEKITEKITELKTKDFEIYISRLQNKFLETMVIRDNKEKFNEEIEKYGIIHGVNYGK
ncbi:MAG: TIGR04255 family protein [Clostridia bacterium]|nr:TIGR04255 family protein [Clostridia bacterium]